MRLLRSRERTLLPIHPVKPHRAAHANAVFVGVRPLSGLDRARIRRAKRGRVAAHVAAWIAVGSRKPELEFLRASLERYRGTTPRDLTAPLPEIEVSDAGEFVTSETERRHPIDRIFDGPSGVGLQHDPTTAEVAFQRAAAEAAGAEIGRRAAEIDEDIHRIDRQLREIDEQLDQITSERNDAATARTNMIESGHVNLTPPRVPSIARILFWRFSELGTIVAETIAFSLAIANTNGVDPTNLSVEWAQGAALTIIASALLALVTAGGTFVLAEAASEYLTSSGDQDMSGHRRRRWTAIFFLAVVAMTLATIAFMRAELGTAGEVSIGTIARYFVLVAMPLVAGTVAHARAAGLTALRVAACTRAATPDHLDVASKFRREQELELLGERVRLRAERDASSAERQTLNAAVFGGDQVLHDIARHEQRVVAEWLDSLRSALAVDRDAFRTIARVRGRDNLLAAPSEPAKGALVPIRRTRRTA